MLTRPVKKGYDVYNLANKKRGIAMEDEFFQTVKVKYEDGTVMFTSLDVLVNGREALYKAHQDLQPGDTAYFGKKADNGKPRMDLLLTGMPNALEGVAEILTFGAKKYAAHSWKTVPDASDRYLAALMRHLVAHSKGELVDPESGQSHLSHAACNALFILELEKTK